MLGAVARGATLVASASDEKAAFTICSLFTVRQRDAFGESGSLENVARSDMSGLTYIAAYFRRAAAAPPTRYTVCARRRQSQRPRARAAPDRVPPSQAPGPAPLYKSQTV